MNVIQLNPTSHSLFRAISIQFLVFLGTCVCAFSQSAEIVKLGADGRLVYEKYANEGQTSKTNQMIDFSRAGYLGGEVAIPFIPTVVELEPSGSGDDHSLIQGAIDAVSKRPLSSAGFRGAILLKKGIYPISAALRITHSGVIVRGEGQGPQDTIVRLMVDETRSMNVFEVVGEATWDEVDDSSVAITDDLVPSGARSLNVASTDDFQVGDRVIVFREPTTKWITRMGMHDIYNPRERNLTNWTASQFQSRLPRRIVDISGNTLTLDSPVTNAIEIADDYASGSVYRYQPESLVENVGIENLRLEATYSVAESDAAFHTEQRLVDGVMFTECENAWVRRVTARHLGRSCVSANRHSQHITVEDCAFIDPDSKPTQGGARYSFDIRGAAFVLMQRCYSDRGRHDFVTSGRATPGPNVFVDCYAHESSDDMGPHERYAEGILYDNVRGNKLFIQNRAWAGSGHGWAGAQNVLWNCATTGRAICTTPPGAMNFAIGCVGTKAENISIFSDPERRPQNGLWESHGAHVLPRSLYYAQLEDRLGTIGLLNVARRSQLTGEMWDELAAWQGNSAPAGTLPLNQLHVVPTYHSAKKAGQLFQLNASILNALPSNIPIMIEWIQETGPVDAAIWGVDRQQASVYFPQAGTYRFRVQVSQQDRATATDTITIEVLNDQIVEPASGNLNLAVLKGSVASQNGTDEYPASNAISGDRQGWASNNTITQTRLPDSEDGGTYWQVDLAETSVIDSIQIYNRTSSEQSASWLSNFQVSVLDTFGTVVFSKSFYRDNGYAEPMTLVSPGGVLGRIVRIELLGKNRDNNNILSLNEVEVYGLPVDFVGPEVSELEAAPVLAVNLGGDTYTSSTGITYQSGATLDGSNSIMTDGYSNASHPDALLYQSLKWHQDLIFEWPVPDGVYDLTLKFSETFFREPNQRVFSVFAEGQEIITDLDIYAEVGRHAPLDRTARVEVKDGRLDLEFLASINHSVCSAVLLRPLTSGVLFAINMGGDPYTSASEGIFYESGRSISGNQGDGSQSVPGDIDNDATLYQSFQWARDLAFTRPVPDGIYDLTLKFIETTFDSNNQRVFSVSAEGEEIVTNLDIHAKVGKLIPYDVTTRIEVTDGSFDLEFNASVNNSSCAAIVLTRLGSPVLVNGRYEVGPSNNVALGGSPIQSTTYGSATADIATDGNQAGSWGNGEVTHTENRAGSFWRIDLERPVMIEEVILHNRTNGSELEKRLSNFRLSAYDAGGKTVFTQIYHSSAQGTWVGRNESFAIGTIAQSFQIQHVGPNARNDQVLSLAEVEIMAGELIHVAEVLPFAGLEPEPIAPPIVIGDHTQHPTIQGNPTQYARQSNTVWGGVAERAIDGNTDGDYGQRSVTYTRGSEFDNYWEIDLTKDVTIHEVILHNRDRMKERLSNFYIVVTREDGTETFRQLYHKAYNEAGQRTRSHVEESERFDLGTVVGRTVRIQFDGKNGEGNGALSLAEVNVMGPIEYQTSTDSLSIQTLSRFSQVTANESNESSQNGSVLGEPDFSFESNSLIPGANYQWSTDLAHWYEADGVDGPSSGLHLHIEMNPTNRGGSMKIFPSGPTHSLFFRTNDE